MSDRDNYLDMMQRLDTVRWMVTPIFLLHTPPVSANTRRLITLLAMAVTRDSIELPCCRRLAEAHSHPFRRVISSNRRPISHPSTGRRISSPDQAPRSSSRCYLSSPRRLSSHCHRWARRRYVILSQQRWLTKKWHPLCTHARRCSTPPRAVISLINAAAVIISYHCWRLRTINKSTRSQ